MENDRQFIVFVRHDRTKTFVRAGEAVVIEDSTVGDTCTVTLRHGGTVTLPITAEQAVRYL